MVILLGFNNGRAERMTPVRAQVGCSAQPVRRAVQGSVLRRAAAVCRRTKASWPAAWCGGFPAGTTLRFLLRRALPPGARRVGRALESPGTESCHGRTEASDSLTGDRSAAPEEARHDAGHRSRRLSGVNMMSACRSVRVSTD
jgi:hypothetical protein